MVIETKAAWRILGYHLLFDIMLQSAIDRCELQENTTAAVIILTAIVTHSTIAIHSHQ